MRKYFGKLFGTHKVWMAGLLCVTVALALIIGNHAFAAGDTVTLHIYKFWGSTEHAAVSYRYVDDVTNAEIMDSVTEIKPVGENYSHTPPDPIISGGRTYNYISADAPLSGLTLSGGLVITLSYRQSFTVKGYVWPMVTNDQGFGSVFLDKFNVVVELRPTFNTPADSNLSTIATSVNGELGQFAFYNVPIGEYVLYIKRPGCLARAMKITISDSDPAIIELVPPGVADNGVFNLWQGDCDDNGRVDNDDVVMIITLLGLGVDASSPSYNPACDLNADGRIDNSDILLVLGTWNKVRRDYPGAESINFLI